jgi:hypothetical protein
MKVNRRLVELQFHGPAKSGMIFIVQGHKTKGLEAAGTRCPCWLQDLGHTTNSPLTCLTCYGHEITWLKRFREYKQSTRR